VTGGAQPPLPHLPPVWLADVDPARNIRPRPLTKGENAGVRCRFGPASPQGPESTVRQPRGPCPARVVRVPSKTAELRTSLQYGTFPQRPNVSGSTFDRHVSHFSPHGASSFLVGRPSPHRVCGPRHNTKIRPGLARLRGPLYVGPSRSSHQRKRSCRC
jgi:hypothetical protein